MQMPHVKACQIPEIIPDLINTGAMMRPNLTPYGPYARRAPDRRTQTAASGGAMPSVFQEIQSGSEEIASNPVAVQSLPLAVSLLLLTHSYSTKPSRYGGVFQKTLFHNCVDWNVIFSFEQPISHGVSRVLVTPPKIGR
jgi:hypothetical protein